MKVTKGIVSTFILFSLFLIFFSCEKRTEEAIIGSPAPDFTLIDLDGNKVSLSDYRKKVVLIDFWATWCLPCKESIPFIEGLYRRYKDKGFMVIGVSFDEDIEIVRRFKNRFDMTYPVIMGEDRIKNIYGLIGLPEMFILDRDGILRYHHLGFNPSLTDKIEKEVKDLLDLHQDSSQPLFK